MSPLNFLAIQKLLRRSADVPLIDDAEVLAEASNELPKRLGVGYDFRGASLRLTR